MCRVLKNPLTLQQVFAFSNSALETQEQCVKWLQWRRSGVFIVKFVQM